jgi:PAS domain S-box-containing protein
MKNVVNKMLAATLASACLLAAWPAQAAEKLTLGVFAYRPKAVMEARYQPLADYLGSQLKGTQVELKVFDQSEVEQEIAANGIDLLLTNPSHYMVVRSRNALSGALATLISEESGQPTASLGGVIVVLADGPGRNITTLADLKGRKIAIPGPKYLGGYQAQAYELLQAGIKMPGDVRLEVVGSHDRVIDTLLNGEADAGFVRTGIIEELTRSGRLDPSRLRVINQQSLGRFPYLTSTRLYPEWAFVALPHVDDRKTRKIAAALLALDNDHPAARAAGIAGFAPPADYLPVENLARALRVEPFDQPVVFSAGDAWRQYWPYLAGSGIVFSLILLLSLRLAVGNRRLAVANAENKAVTHRLALEHQHLETLLGTLPDAVWLKDVQGVYLDCNRRFEALYGVPKNQIVGKTDFDFVEPALAEMFRANDRLAIEAGVARTNEEWVTFASDGHRELWQATKCPMFGPSGELVGVLGIGHNITEHKRLETELEAYGKTLAERVEARSRELMEMEQRATSILQSSAAGLYGVDGEGRIIFINRAACTLLGVTESTAIGAVAHTLFHHRRADGSPYPIDECPTHLAMREGVVAENHTDTYWCANGQSLPVMVWIHPLLEDGRHVGAVVSFVDVTEQREAEAAKTRALEAAEQLARVRSEFVANMSHEIRTPLNGILGFSEIGLRNMDNPEKLRNALAKVKTAGQHLRGVIDDVLDFSKIEAGKLQTESINVPLHASLEEVVNLMHDAAQGKGLTLSLEKSPDLPATCLGDPLRLRQVLLNLLSNAVKFTESGRVALTAGLSRGELLLRVVDTGIGMAAAQIAHVFEPFIQADGSNTRRYGGTGLGLAISRHLVELMGGRIAVESQLGRGTTFEIFLPYQPARALPAPAPAQAAAASDYPQTLAGVSVLVAEDDLINREIMVENLTLSGARVVAVENGLDAFSRVQERGADAFDIVLMDVQMPVMGGHEATQRILEVAPGLPIIGQTAHAYGEERDKCFASGMVGHVAKPIDYDVLEALMLQHLPAAPSARPDQ